jgi:hypothetical protein
MRADIVKNLQEVTDEIIAEINPPAGWVAIDELSHSLIAPVPYINDEDIKKSLKLTLPIATSKAELLIKEIERRFEIKITETYLTVDSLNSFHLVLLVTQHDFLSPKMQAVRVLAEGMLNSNSAVSIRHTFSIDEEHIRAHSGAEGYKLLHMARA